MSDEAEPHIRHDGRAPDALRTVAMAPGWVGKPPGSVLVRQGSTWVLCTTTIDDRVPFWMRGRGRGWLTATYAMLPGSTAERSRRERAGPRGRTSEIERLVGRSLRMAVDLDRIGERTLHVDCDVLQADGGTRTAAITGGWLAVALATRPLAEKLGVEDNLMSRQLAAVSVGVVDGEPMLDLDYSEDLRAETDLNAVMTAEGDWIEIQGTGEKAPFSGSELGRMLDLATSGIQDLIAMQTEALGG